MAPLRFRNLRFTASSEEDQERGLLGFVSVALGPVRLDSIAVRRKLDGSLGLSFPERRDGRGIAHPIIRPLGDRERRAVEFEILRQLGLEGGPGR